jgi:hypothetical protein
MEQPLVEIFIAPNLGGNSKFIIKPPIRFIIWIFGKLNCLKQTKNEIEVLTFVHTTFGLLDGCIGKHEQYFSNSHFVVQGKEM